jgi:integrase
MNFTDIAYLKVENIIDGRIRFRRKKTGKLYDIRITKQLGEILELYLDGKRGGEHIFPVIKREDPAKQEREICLQKSMPKLILRAVLLIELKEIN